MNIIRNQFKCITNFKKILTQVKQNYTQYANLPKTWVMPKKICSVEPEKSGDMGINFNIKESDYITNFEKSKELVNADDNVKKLFSVEFHRKKDLVNLRMRKGLKLVQRHDTDIGSMEAKIAAATVEILRLQEHYKKLPTEKRGKVFLKELIEKRKKWLKKLRILDYPRFEFLLERLNIIYRPILEKDIRLTIKGSIRQLHAARCDQIVRKKLDDYKAELKAQQKNFFVSKVEKLTTIRQTEIECGVTPSVSEKEIEKAKEQAASFL